MKFGPAFDIDEPRPPKPSTRKKRWNAKANTWDDVSIWRVPMNRDRVKWLGEMYGAPNLDNFNTNYQGWTMIAGYIWMCEDIFLFYSLKFTDE